MATYFLCIALALLPVTLFLIVLVTLDSYELVPFRVVLALVASGALAALACLFVNPWLANLLSLGPRAYSRTIAAFVEELSKGSVIMVAIFRQRLGFLVDAAIWGFALGTGFASVENIHYFVVLGEPNPTLWAIRGLGTAVMHGGATAILAVITKLMSDRRGRADFKALVPGYLAAVGLHGAYNQFFLTPSESTLAVLLFFPLLFVVVFRASVKSTEEWLGSGFDSDQDLLEIINRGKISETRVGRYLRNLKNRFRPEVVADMLCLIRLHVELSIRAKGTLLLRKNGFEMPPDPGLEGRLRELEYLQESIGRTGMLALEPIFHTSSRDLWQLHLLQSGASRAARRGDQGG